MFLQEKNKSSHKGGKRFFLIYLGKLVLLFPFFRKSQLFSTNVTLHVVCRDTNSNSVQSCESARLLHNTAVYDQEWRILFWKFQIQCKHSILFFPIVFIEFPM